MVTSVPRGWLQPSRDFTFHHCNYRSYCWDIFKCCPIKSWQETGTGNRAIVSTAQYHARRDITFNIWVQPDPADAGLRHISAGPRLPPTPLTPGSRRTAPGFNFILRPWMGSDSGTLDVRPCVSRVATTSLCTRTKPAFRLSARRQNLGAGLHQRTNNAPTNRSNCHSLPNLLPENQ